MAKDREQFGWSKPAVRAALAAAAQSGPAVAALARRIAEIPAPTFHEADRAAFVAEQFTALGFTPAGDEAGNVIACRAGTQPVAWIGSPSPARSTRTLPGLLGSRTRNVTALARPGAAV